MSTPTPAYAFGALLGSFQRAREEFARQLVAGFLAGKTPNHRLTPEQLEARAERLAEKRHQVRIEAERTRGLTFVASYAKQVRRELGLVDA